MDCFATCTFGVEALVKDELAALGLKVTATEDARVFFSAERAGVVDANLWLRCADRVFVSLAVCPAKTFAELFDHVRAVPWHTLLPRDAKIIVTGKTALSALGSVRDVQRIAKKAICDAMIEAHGYARCPETGQSYNIEIGLLRDVATVALNTSGAGLNRRGYRDLEAQAPIRETLAAALVRLAQYRGNEVLIDPCCGSGTIAIEAAMIAANIAPGLKRTFAFDGWKAWAQTAAERREAAAAKRRESGFPHLYASDIEPKYVTMARRHAIRAGVNGFINFDCRDVRDFNPPAPNGVIVVNPPYGERMEQEQASVVLTALKTIRRKHPQFGLYIISSDQTLEKSLGQPADRRRKLYNGSIKCNLYMYKRVKK